MTRVDAQRLQELLAHFLAAWHGAVGKSCLRALEGAVIGSAWRSPRSVLDLGCGDGVFSRGVFPRSAIVGVDDDDARLVHARVHLDDAILASLEQLPLRDAGFDRVLCNSTLEHVGDVESAVREMERVLAPGGQVALTLPLPAKEESLFFNEFESEYARSFHDYWGHVHVRSLDDWKALIGDVAPSLQLAHARPFETTQQARLVDLLYAVPQARRAAPAYRWSETARPTEITALLASLMSFLDQGSERQCYAEVLLIFSKAAATQERRPHAD